MGSLEAARICRLHPHRGQAESPGKVAEGKGSLGRDDLNSTWEGHLLIEDCGFCDLRREEKALGSGVSRDKFKISH